MPPRSKRARKAKDRLSLRSKGGGGSTIDSQRLDEEQTALDSNVEILVAKDRTESVVSGPGTDAPKPERRLSKSQQRKLRRIEEEKERRAKRSQILKSLSEFQLNSEQLSMLRPTAARGQRETKKEALRRALKLQRAGVQFDDDVQLLRERGDRDTEEIDHDHHDNSSMLSTSSSEEDERRYVQSGVNNTIASRNDSEARAPLARQVQHTAEDEPKPAKRPRFSQIIATQTANWEQHDNLQDVPAKQANAEPERVTGIKQSEEIQAAVSKAREEIEADAGTARLLKSFIDDDNGYDEINALVPRKRRSIHTVEMEARPIEKGPSRVVIVERPAEIEAMRSELPIIGMEQEIMEAISEHDVVILCGATGCGKTTQMPQFLFEAGYGNRLFPERSGMIGITQPRRVAAVSTATRVAEELGGELGQIVGYQVRYDKHVGGDTAMKFMTDGILLREVQTDFLLRKYSVIVIDEAHERSLNTDILLGVLSRISSLRRSMFLECVENGSKEDCVYPLKLVIMSATLRTEDFVGNKRLFPETPPVLNVPSRQFPVTVHFSRRTELHDYVGAAFRKTCQIHRRLPPGGILVFVTGQREVEYLCRKLKNCFRKRRRRGNPTEQIFAKGSAESEPADHDADNGVVKSGRKNHEIGAGDELMLLEALEEDRYQGQALNESDDGAYSQQSDDDSEEEDAEEEPIVVGGDGLTAEQIQEAEQAFEISLKEMSQVYQKDVRRHNDKSEDVEQNDVEAGSVHVLPLYAMLPSAQQVQVFQPPPPGSRLIVVATNVAETSLTIPGIRYVVDAGRSKQKILEANAGLARYEVRWVSQASAEQRAGRAGRTGPGHCYRLYSSAVFNDTFPRYSPPEIANTSLESVALALKNLGVHKLQNFPFPSPPEENALLAAERCLISLMALDSRTGSLTRLGKEMALFPISPRHARMLLEVIQDVQVAADEDGQARSVGEIRKKKEKRSIKNKISLLSYAIATAAALSVQSPFIHVDGSHLSVGVDKHDAVPSNTTTIAGEGSDDYKEDDDVMAKHTRKQIKTAKKEENRKQRDAARAAQDQFRIADSDALSALCALCAFEAAGESESFCRENFLHFKNLREAASLRRQLARLISASQSSSSSIGQRIEERVRAEDVSSPPSWPIRPHVFEALRRALTAGWADHVARRVRSIAHIFRHRQNEEQSIAKKGRAVRYLPCILDEEVYLHPNSSSHALAPEYVIYTEIVRTSKRAYMSGVTAIDPVWLPHAAEAMCVLSDPLPAPPPFYSHVADRVFCWRDATYGSHMWPLPRHASPHPDLEERAAAFADALLSGRVLKSTPFTSSTLAALPTLSARPESRMQRRAMDLLAALKSSRVDSKKSLGMKWKQSPEYLKKELSHWLRKGQAQTLVEAWPSILEEACARISVE